MFLLDVKYLFVAKLNLLSIEQGTISNFGGNFTAEETAGKEHGSSAGGGTVTDKVGSKLHKVEHDLTC